jgi:hypothetical protein
LSNAITYRPPPSLVPFLRSESFVSLCSGPVGSGKSSAGVVKIAWHAARMKPGKDGIRRSRCAVVRNTGQMLTDSTIPTFFTWFPDGVMGVFARTDKNFTLRFADVECEVLFRGLDDPKDVRRLLSLELSFAFMDEYREIHKDIFEALSARIGRYPSMAHGGCFADDGSENKHLWGTTNAPDMDTFWEEYMSGAPKNARIFRQPSARSPEADWLANLPPGYYDDIMEGKSEDWIRVYVDNEFGRSLSGQPVFRCFDRTLHVAKTPLSLIPGQPLVIGVDAGLNPTAVLTQQTYDGRVIVLDAITGHAGGMGALRFAREMLKPLLTSKYPQAKSMLVIDPAAFQRAQTDERSVADVFRAEGFFLKPARTNALAARLAVVEKYLTRTVNGNPGMLISPTADLLIQALAGRYRYRINTRGERDTTPEKNHPWSDVSDSIHYACLFHDGGESFAGREAGQRREIKRAPWSWAAV